MYPTLQDIAREVGVSQPVVSKVLNGGKSMGANASDETKQKIIEAADRMGYRRHMAAVALKKQRFNVIGLLLSSDDRSELPPQILRGISDHLKQVGMTLSISSLNAEALKDSYKMPHILQEWGIDGVLIHQNPFHPEQIEQLIWRSRIPAMWINDPRETDAIYADDFDAGKKATTRLLAACHQRIQFVASEDREPCSHRRMAQRRAGYEHAMQEAGLHPDVVNKIILNQAEHFTTSPHAPTAVIANSCDSLPHLAIHLAQQGLRIPQDLSLVGFSPHPYALDKPVTCLQVPHYHIGQHAVKELLKKFDEKRITSDSMAIPHNWSEGETIAPPRS
ncbi:LacI family DNA-binding transcriptional regulator [Kiritimatiellota bacterium B12222]|nr:LacI family DNA-binding transcriptional regulator [Kiritimatiellota bacterium B12222]